MIAIDVVTLASLPVESIGSDNNDGRKHRLLTMMV